MLTTFVRENLGIDPGDFRERREVALLKLEGSQSKRSGRDGQQFFPVQYESGASDIVEVMYLSGLRRSRSPLATTVLPQ